MLRRDSAGKIIRSPAKIGDKVVMFINKNALAQYIGVGFTAMKPYKVVATQLSKEENRVCFKHVYPLFPRPSKFGVFIIDDLGDKRYVNIGTDVFGITVEVLPK